MLSNSGGVIHRLREFTIGKHHLEVYSLNMQGALGLDQIELRQVRQILPGVKLVKLIDSVYGQYDLSVLRVDDNTIRYVRKPAGSESSIGEVVTRGLDWTGTFLEYLKNQVGLWGFLPMVVALSSSTSLFLGAWSLSARNPL